MSETCFFFYRGKWPAKLPARSRMGGITGTTWDDTWGNVPVATLEDFTLVPYSLKSLVFDDMWSSNKEAPAEEHAEGEEEDDEDEEEAKAKEEKKGVKTKEKKGKKEKKAKKKDLAKGGQNPLRAGRLVGVERPERLEIAMVAAAEDEMEPLFHNEYSSALWFQAINEWSAGAAIIFTPGHGLVGIEAVQREVKVLLIDCK